MEEGVISMLYESGMAPSFWGEALASFIHVSNKVTTAVSRLQVWGCTSYVLIQRDKQPLGSLGVHMKKCIFIGYPQGYKAWKFYNPVTKKVQSRTNKDDKNLHRFLLGSGWL